jgi:hypothetical protein
MATCKDCLHIDSCKQWYTSLPDKYHDGCDNFKNRNHFVELPCKIGQTAYEVVYLRNGTVSHISPLKVVGIHIGDFPDLRGHKRKSYLVVVYPTSEILGRIPLDKVGKTLFMTKKEAEAAHAMRDGEKQ